jgi:hypothetical protein
MAAWDNMSSDQKDLWVKTNLTKSFINAKKPANIGQVTPKDYFLLKLKEIYDGTYTAWLNANEWFLNVTLAYEQTYGFFFDETYVPAVTPPTPSPETPDDEDEPEHAPNENQLTGFLKKNKGYILIGLLAIVVIFIFSISTKE